MGKKSQCEPFLPVMIELTQQGKSRPEIATELGLPLPAVNGFLDRRGIRPAHRRGMRPVYDRDEIQRLIEVEHLTQQQVADRLGCSRSAVDRASSKMRLRTARTGPRAAADHPGWQGGRSAGKHGYIEVYVPLHPAARNGTGRVLEHRLVMEIVLGRYLLPNEVVDHRDNHPRHNWPDNLRVYASNAAHLRATLTGRAKGSPRRSIAGAHPSSPKIDRCPTPDETLAQCPREIRCALERFVSIHQPTKELWDQARSTYLRRGPVDVPFPPTSTE